MEVRRYRHGTLNLPQVIGAGSLIAAASAAAVAPSAEQIVQLRNETGPGPFVEFIPGSQHTKEPVHTPGSIVASLTSASSSGTNTTIGVLFGVAIPVIEPLPGLITRQVSELTEYLRADENVPGLIRSLRSA